MLSATIPKTACMKKDLKDYYFILRHWQHIFIQTFGKERNHIIKAFMFMDGAIGVTVSIGTNKTKPVFDFVANRLSVTFAEGTRKGRHQIQHSFP